VVHEEAVRQRAKTRIDMVEAFVRQSDRHDLEVEKLLNLFVRLYLSLCAPLSPS
jgi:hypothetical protein